MLALLEHHGRATSGHHDAPNRLSDHHPDERVQCCDLREANHVEGGRRNRQISEGDGSATLIGAEDLLNISHSHGDNDVSRRGRAEPYKMLKTGGWARLNRAEIAETAHVRGGDALRKPGNTEKESRKPEACRRIWSVKIGRAENDRVEPWPADKRLAAVAGSPEVHVVAGSTKHDVAIRGAAWSRSTVRSAED